MSRCAWGSERGSAVAVVLVTSLKVEPYKAQVPKTLEVCFAAAASKMRTMLHCKSAVLACRCAQPQRALLCRLLSDTCCC